MAEAVAFPEANLLLLAPPGTEDSCGNLPVRRLDGAIVSCWRPTAEEMAEILETGVIWLSVWGKETAPPVLVTGHKAWVI